MKLVYIAGPYRAPTPWGVEKNIRNAEEWAMVVAMRGGVPVCPHTMNRYFDKAEGIPDAFWLEGTLELMRRCDAVLLLPNWNSSVGARAEREEALRLGLPVFDAISLPFRLASL